MGLSNDLISQFVKITKDNESGKKESTAYGSIVKYNNKTYVKLDGSELLTPVTTTTDVEENERVTVTIKNHTATVTGNISSPSARTDTVKEIDKEVTVIGNKISEFEIVIADKVSTTELDAERAKIEQLQAENVTISGKLTANEADISKLETDNITINEKLTAAEADIDKLSVDNVTISGKVSAAEADIKNIKADNVTISGKVTANEADISKLETDNAVINEKLVANSADINVLEADYATINGKVSANEASINNLEATMMTSDHAVIKNLQSDVAEIDTLIFGSASGNVIQTSFANAVIAQLGNAQIKSAMIESVTASQITAGDIITNNVRVMSEDGSLVISDETLQISDGTRVRVQIGKDAASDYSINIWDASGNLMFSKGGITDAAIKNAIIRNDMVAANANISASKLDIDSLFTEINNSSKTIKSTKVYLDEKGQTLDAAFTSMTTDVNGIRGTVESQGTQISVMQGQIANKIWQTDIDTTIDKLEIGGRNYIVLSNLDSYTSYNTIPTYSGKVISTTMAGTLRYLTLASLHMPPNNVMTISGYIKVNGLIPASRLFTGMASTYGTALHSNEYDSDTGYFSITQTYSGDDGFILHAPIDTYISSGDVITLDRLKFEKGNKATDWTPAPEDVEGEISTLSTKYSEVKQTVDGLSTTVAAHTTQISNKADSSTVTAVNNKVSELEQNLDGFKTTVSNTYTTKTEFDNLEIGGRNYVTNAKRHEIWRTSGIGSTVDTYHSECPNGVYLIGEQGGASCVRLSNVITSNGYWTVSFDVRGSQSSAVGFNIDICDCGPNTPVRTTTDNNWVRHSYTANVTNYSNDIYNFVDFEYIGWAYIFIRNIKVEKGNRATDWTPAPEDVEGEISTVSDKVSTLEQNLDGFKTTVSNTYTTKTEFDNLEIGGRNLMLADYLVYGSRATTSTEKYALGYAWVDPLMATTNLLKMIQPSTEYTISCVFECVSTSSAPTLSDTRFGFAIFSHSTGQYCGLSPLYHSGVINVGDKLPYAITFTTPATIPSDIIFTAYTRYWTTNGNAPISYDSFMIHNLKLEKGNKATDWTPAPEDVDKKINLRATKTEVNQLSDRITSTVSDVSALGTRMSTVEQKADGLTIQLSDTNTRIDTLEIGGRNLLPDSERVRTTTRFMDIPVYNIFPSYIGRSITISFDMKLNDSSFLGRGIMVYPYQNNGVSIKDSTSVYPTSEYTRFVFRTVVYDWGDNGIYTDGAIAFYDWNGENNYSIRRIKIELGDKPTDWTPAVEDVNSSIANSAKTATNYLNFSNGGLTVGNMTASTLGNNVLIDTDSVDIRNGTTTLASYQSNKIELGKNSPSAIIDMCSGTAQFTNKNDVSGIDWYRLGITSRDAIGLETGGEVTMDTHNENAAGEYADGIFRMSSCQPWNMNLYGFEEAYAHLIVKNYISGILKQAKLEMYPQLGTNLLHTHKAGTAGVYLYGGGGSGDTWSEVSRMDLEAEAINTKTSSFKMTTNNSKIYGKDPNGVEKAVFIPQNQYGNTIVGYENYTTGKGNTNLYGQDLNFSSSEAGNVTYRPYYRGNGLTTEGDTINITIRTAGFVTSSGAGVQFTVPLAKPIIGNPTVTASSVNGFQLRCNGYYTHGSSASSYATPSSYSVTTTNGGNNVVITATFSNTTNISNDTVSLGARNNSPIGIYWSGKLTITFG